MRAAVRPLSIYYPFVYFVPFVFAFFLDKYRKTLIIFMI